MNRATINTERRALARLELLVLLTTVFLTVAAGAQWVGSRPADSPVMKCLDHLRRIGQVSHMVAHDDMRLIPHRQSSAGTTNWIGLGAYDWGGNNGVDPQLGGPGCTTACISAATRPYNRYFTPDQYDVYRCPSDVGYEPNPNYTGSSNPAYLQSVSDATGTSYQGDFLRFSGGSNYTNRSGTFMRPLHLIPNAAETILFYEARFAQAMLSTSDFETFVPSYVPTTVTPWHSATGRFNVLYVDGHADRVFLTAEGPVIPILSFPASSYAGAVMIRGPGWRYDAMPDVFVRESFNGDPYEYAGDPLAAAPVGDDEHADPKTAIAIRSSPECRPDGPDQ